MRRSGIGIFAGSVRNAKGLRRLRVGPVDPSRNIAVLIDPSTLWGCSIIEGVKHYAAAHSWSLRMGVFVDHELQPLQLTGLDGCIARVGHGELAEQIRRAGLPAVNVSWTRHGEEHISICNADAQSAADLAARHFLEHGHCRFGYFGPPVSPVYCNLFRQTFLEVVARAGHECSILDVPGPPSALPRARWRLANWLNFLTKPVAVLAFDTFYGRQVSEVCAQIGIRIPDEVSVLCGELDRPPSSDEEFTLSGIDLNRRRLGHEAAALLTRLMDGAAPPAAPILIPPRGIESHRSTDALVFTDPVLCEALQFIKAKATDPIQVGDVVHHLAVSRRLLEGRFRDCLKRSPAQEIRRVRLERSRRLLSDHALSIRAVAALSGFDHPEVFSRAFQREFGISPSDYRLQNDI